MRSKQHSMKQSFRVCLVLVLALCVLLLSGCSLRRTALPEMGQEGFNDVGGCRETAKDFIDAWGLRSGFIRSYLGHRMSEMPSRFIEAMKALDEMYEYRDNLTDIGYGAVLGFHLRLAEEIVRATLKIHAPELLRYLSN